MKLSTSKLASIVILIALAVTVIWGATGICGGWGKSWLAMLIGVVISGIIKIIGRDE